jgi:hypothetical protein
VSSSSVLLGKTVLVGWLSALYLKVVSLPFQSVTFESRSALSYSRVTAFSLG